MIDRSGCPGYQHGTASDYRNRGCRCRDAAEANTRYQKLRRAGLLVSPWVNSVGVVRRRQALGVMGYSLADLAPYFGTSARGVGNYSRRAHVHRSTFERWCQVYDELAMTPGPNRKARGEALRRRWAPPLAWDEDTIDDPAAKPDLGSRRARDRASLAEEARFLLGFRLPLPVVAKRLNVTESWLRQLLGGGKRAAA